MATHIPHHDISKLAPGDHVCHFHSGSNSLSLMTRFVRAGLDERQQTVIVAPSGRLSQIREGLSSGLARRADVQSVRLHSIAEVIERAGGAQP